MIDFLNFQYESNETILVYPRITLKRNSASVTQNSFIATQNIDVLFSIYISMKIHQFYTLSRPKANLDAITFSTLQP